MFDRTLRGVDRKARRLRRVPLTQQCLWDGLGVLDFAIVPHVDSPDHPESRACGLVADRYRAASAPYRTLSDGEVLVIDGDSSAICR